MAGTTIKTNQEWDGSISNQQSFFEESDGEKKNESIDSIVVRI